MRTAMTPERRAELLGFPVRRMLSAEPAVLAELQFVRSILLILCRSVITLLALGASQGNDIPHDESSSPLPSREGEASKVYIKR